MEDTVEPGRRGVAGAVAALVLVVLAGLTVWTLQPPSARPADAAPAEFSAERAFAATSGLAAVPHPAGSAANDEVREQLVAQLRGLGLDVEVQDAVAAESGDLSSSRGAEGMARVRNVLATLPGADPSGSVVLVAHYDSVQTAPGGNDDLAGIATLAESARALAAGPRPRNDVVFAFTDAEEACLCGAAEIARGGRFDPAQTVVLNVEARGSSGPSVMFETSEDNSALVGAYRRGAPHPVGTSFAVEVYRLLPNDTDFTPFRLAGFRGLNSAYIDGAAVYHTPLDTPAAMDRDSLQHSGDNTLGVARELAGADLTALVATSDATYFPVLGALATYPGAWTWPVAVVALAGVVALAVVAVRRGRTTGRRLVAGTALAVLPPVLAAAAAQGLWALVVAVRPGYAELLDPYRPTWYRLAVLALAAAVVLGWYGALRRRVGAAAPAIGGLGALALLGLLLAWAVPGGSYLAALPALAGALAGLVAVHRPGTAARVAATLAAAVAVVVLLPAVVLLLPALTLWMAGAGAFVAALLLLAALPVVELWVPARGPAVPGLVALVAAVALAAVGLAVDRFDAEHPAPTQLMYALDTTTGEARWVSEEDDPQPWTSRFVDGRAALPQFPPLGDGELSVGPAAAADLPAPEVTVTDDRVDGAVRTVTLSVVPQRAARMLALYVDSSTAGVRSVTVDGVPGRLPDGGGWAYGLVFHAPPPDGVSVTMELTAQRGEAGPAPREVGLRVVDASDGLADLPGFEPRPDDVGIAAGHSSELVLVAADVTV